MYEFNFFLFAGVYGRNTDVQIFIDVNDVVELRSHLITDDNLVFGGGVTLTESIGILMKTARMDGFGYLKNFAKHIERIGNVAIRNVIIFKINWLLFVYSKFVFLIVF